MLAIALIQAIERAGKCCWIISEGMPVASNCDQPEKAFHFEELMESIRKREHVHCHSHASWNKHINTSILQVISGFCRFYTSTEIKESGERGAST